MMRYFRLYMNILRYSFSKVLEFRLDFYFRIIMDIFFYIIAISFFKVLYLHTSVLAEWTESQMMIFVAGTLMLDGFMMTVFANSMWWFPVLVNRGDLDYYITRPASTLFFMSVRDFSATSLVNLCISFGVFIWSILNYEHHIPLWQVLLYIVLIFNGAVLYYMFNMMFYFPVFWTGSPRGFGTLYWTMVHAAERPDRIYRGIIRKVFLTALPFGIMVSYPARLILEGFDWAILGHIVLVTVIIWPIYLFFWSKGLRAYTSASS